MKFHIVTKFVFLAAIAVSALDFSGKVVNLDGTPRSGAMVFMASTGKHTFTDSSGSWSLKGAASVLRKESVRPVSAHLVADGGHLRLSWQGKNIMGRVSAAASGQNVAAHPASLAARVALVTSDTLEYSFRGYVFLRDTFSESRSEMVRVYDTLANPANPSPFGMNHIPAGTFMMGSPTTETGRSSDETQHEASVSAFWMDRTDVTRSQYHSLMGILPAGYTCKSSTCPVEGVTWFDAVLYCNARSRRDGLDTMYSYTSLIVPALYGYATGDLPGLTLRHGVAAPGYRLPTEAEWEYAARGGTKTAYYWGDDDLDAVRKYAWWWSNGAQIARPVAMKPENAYGLYDMAGNVYQWVGDFYDTYPTTATKDYEGPATGYARVMRGGDSFSVDWDLRSANREWRGPGNGFSLVGFRCVRSGP
ncbi:MAG: SUMF1/EgtB/PvdO family nonheme iron enzyme [Fibrobacterota bacterium]|nr:SUMF1/EgtB/PvdO family nonheme iron enzyme [Fibrobacterota bacterium]QQS05829.1 MAG: SUMF1/EgtB/PvdO family nonheme iron enzyme [Fibrobacterota bacterium]